MFYSLIIDSFLVLLLGAFILGIGQSATLQTRYAASFVAGTKFKATALSLAVGFSVFGSIFGPRMVGSYSNFFENISSNLSTNGPCPTHLVEKTFFIAFI